ncbi:MAG: A/G-specific adenine glycosylase [Bacteroidales bacterium]|nr:A/G-specific adenine glycosylase [Bacteroidales bacterium]
MDFAASLAHWYHQNKRDLPWRNTNDPYKIWVSEIILQQTRVNQGLNYYLNFINTFPTVAHLARAPLDDVLKLWQGLGYYTRARNLYTTARIVHTKLKNVFPGNYKDLLLLKGIGEYTAAAIASFAYNEPVAVIDGNVIRVLSRYFGIEMASDTSSGKKTFSKLANEILDVEHPGMHNQAIMEFGALQCTPKNPKCTDCPLAESCYALKNKNINDLPLKSKKIKSKDRYFNYIIPVANNRTLISKRNNNDIWHSLYEFILFESHEIIPVEKIFKSRHWQDFSEDANLLGLICISDIYKHKLSHQNIHARFIVVQLDKLPEPKSFQKEIALDMLDLYAMPVLLANFLKTARFRDCLEIKIIVK